MDFSKIEPFEFKAPSGLLQKIKIEISKEKLTAAAGLGTIIEIFDQSGFAKAFTECLPRPAGELAHKNSTHREGSDTNFRRTGASHIIFAMLGKK